MIEGIIQSLRNVLNDKFDIMFIEDYDNKPEPVGPYATVGLTALNQINRSSSTYNNTPTGLEEKLEQDMRALLTITFYGKGSYDKAFQSQAYLKTVSVQQNLFIENCLSVIDLSSIRRIPQMRAEKYIDSATFDVTSLIGSEYTSETDWFDTIELTNNITGNTQQTPRRS